MTIGAGGFFFFTTGTHVLDTRTTVGNIWTEIDPLAISLLGFGSPLVKTATPEELMKLTNGLPWQICAYARISLTGGELLAERKKWEDAGAPCNYGEFGTWMERTSKLLTPCDGGCDVKYFPHPGYKASPRVTFSVSDGFRFYSLCASCTQDFDSAH
jgi:hypothetical protein